MKNILILAVFAVVLGPGTCLAQDTLWTRVFFPGVTASPGQVRCSGTEVYVCGSSGDETQDIFLLKYSSSGNPEWQQTVDLDSFDAAVPIAIGPDGHPVVGGSAGTSSGSGAFLAKFDGTSGDTLWTRQLAGAFWTSLAADGGNSIYALGMPAWPSQPDSFLVARYAPDGTLAWSRAHTLEMGGIPVGIGLDSAGDLYCAVSPFEKAVLVKVSAATGDTLWTKAVLESLTISFSGMALWNDEIRLLANGPSGVLLLNADLAGETLWTRPLSMTTATGDIAVDGSGNCYLAYMDQNFDFAVDKFSLDGQFLGTAHAGTELDDLPVSVAVGSDGYPVVTGMAPDSLGVSKVVTVKFSGTPGGMEDESAGTSLQFAVSPNPVAAGIAVLRVQGSKGSRVTGANVRVFDVSGRCVLDRPLVIGDWSLGIPFDLRRLSGGVYLVRLDAGAYNASQKFVVQR